MNNNDELINKIFFKKYKILKKIGKGSFGMVYLGKALNLDKYVAVKFEPKTQTDLILERETYLLYYLRGFGIPEVLTYGQNSKYNILIQTLLGSSTNYIFHSYNKKFSMKDCCMLGIQMLDRLEYIHSKYIIHRDVKPDNFLVGFPDISIIYLIDFGLAKKYMSSRTGKHVKFFINKKWSGTSRFASANSLRGVVQSRRDDLESLCYILLYFMKGSLPWDNVYGQNENEDIKLIYKIKKFMQPEYLFYKLPTETVEFFKYCKKLDFEQKPDYNYLRSLLLNILNGQNEKNDFNFSWVINNINANTNIINKYKVNHRRKNSPQQRIYNSLISNRIKLTKRSESYNEFDLNKDIDKVKKDQLTLKNISPSPVKKNLPFKLKNNDIIKQKETYKYTNKIPRAKKRIINLVPNNIKNRSFIEKNNNIITKTQTETERLLNKRLNIIPLEKIGSKILKKDSYKKDKNSYNNIPNKKNFFNIKNLNGIKDLNNKLVIRKNNSYCLKDSKDLYSLNIPKPQDFSKFINNNILEDINKEKNIYNLKNNNNFNYNELKSNSYNQKTKINKNIIIKNINDFKNNIIQKINKDKIYNEGININANNKINNNSIFIPKNLKKGHVSPDQLNIYKLKDKNEKIRNNIIILNKKNANYKTNRTKLLNSQKKTILNNYNIIKNSKTFISNDKNQFQPQKEIKIINILSPINKISNNYKIKENSFISRSNLQILNNSNYLSNNNTNSNNKKKDLIHSYYNKNSRNGLFSFYYNNSSLIDKSQEQDILMPKNNKSSFNIENTNNNYTDRIVKTNTSYINNNLNNCFRNNIINFINLKKNTVRGGSFNYTSPKSIEKYRINN